jgi:hypothetical protein
LKAEISTKTNPTIAPPIVGTKGFMPLKVNHQITVADAHKSKNKIKLLFIVPESHFVVIINNGSLMYLF